MVYTGIEHRDRFPLSFEQIHDAGDELDSAPDKRCARLHENFEIVARLEMSDRIGKLSGSAAASKRVASPQVYPGEGRQDSLQHAVQMRDGSKKPAKLVGVAVVVDEQ